MSALAPRRHLTRRFTCFPLKSCLAFFVRGTLACVCRACPIEAGGCGTARQCRRTRIHFPLLACSPTKDRFLPHRALPCYEASWLKGSMLYVVVLGICTRGHGLRSPSCSPFLLLPAFQPHVSYDHAWECVTQTITRRCNH